MTLERAVRLVTARPAELFGRGMQLAIERGLRYLDSGVPDLLWCELPTSAREPIETFCA